MPRVPMYYRQSTAADIRFGYGCTHFATFPVGKCRKADGHYKRWLVDDHGRRWYRC